MNVSQRSPAAATFVEITQAATNAAADLATDSTQMAVAVTVSAPDC